MGYTTLSVGPRFSEDVFRGIKEVCVCVFVKSELELEVQAVVGVPCGFWKPTFQEQYEL